MNETHIEYEINFPHALRNDLLEDWMPENYFCKFEMNLDTKIDWQANIIRYYSILNSEKLELIFENA